MLKLFKREHKILMIRPMLFWTNYPVWTKLNREKVHGPVKNYYVEVKHCKMSAMRASRAHSARAFPSKLPKSPSFRGLCLLDPRRGFAPGPHQGPLSVGETGASPPCFFFFQLVLKGQLEGCTIHTWRICVLGIFHAICRNLGLIWMQEKQK